MQHPNKYNILLQGSFPLLQVYESSNRLNQKPPSPYRDVQMVDTGNFYIAFYFMYKIIKASKNVYFTTNMYFLKNTLQISFEKEHLSPTQSPNIKNSIIFLWV